MLHGPVGINPRMVCLEQTNDTGLLFIGTPGCILSAAFPSIARFPRAPILHKSTHPIRSRIIAIVSASNLSRKAAWFLATAGHRGTLEKREPKHPNPEKIFVANDNDFSGCAGRDRRKRFHGWDTRSAARVGARGPTNRDFV